MKKMMSFILGMATGAMCVIYSSKIKDKLNKMSKKAKKEMQEWQDEMMEGEDFVDEDYVYHQPPKSSTRKKTKGNSTSKTKQQHIDIE